MHSSDFAGFLSASTTASTSAALGERNAASIAIWISLEVAQRQPSPPTCLREGNDSGLCQNEHPVSGNDGVGGEHGLVTEATVQFGKIGLCRHL